MKAEMKKGFTIAELMVAVAIMAVALTAMSWVFKISIDAQRMSAATSEIARNYRAITDQLNSDFTGLRKDCGLFTGSYVYTDILKKGRPETIEVRADSIVFFVNGNFQTTRQYGDPCDPNPKTKTICGNEAKILYTFSGLPDPNDISENGPGPSNPDFYDDRAKQVLLRIQTIYTMEDGLPDPCDFVPSGFIKASFPKEYNRGASLMGWIKTIPSNASARETWLDNKAGELTSRPPINLLNLKPETAPYILCGGVENGNAHRLGGGIANFAIKFEDGFEPNGVIKWWPENKDLDSNGKKVTPKAYTDRYRMIKFEFTLCSKTKVNGLPLKKSFSHIIDFRDE